jgi:hypothetical protein
MSDQGTSRPNGAEPPKPKSLREVAEDAYDEVLDANPEEPAAPAEPGQVDDGTQPRDAQGRFVAKQPAAEPGEAEQPQGAPSPGEEPAPQVPVEQQPAPAGESTGAPAHWSEADRQMFAKLPQEGQTFLLKRHSDMEADYTRKVQASAQAVGFVQTVAPYFQVPEMVENLKAAGWAPADAIREWAGFHLRAIHPDMRVRTGLAVEMVQRLGVDPAVFATSRPGPAGPAPQLSDADLKDPAIRYFADHVSRTVQEVQALRGQFAAMQQASVEQANAEATRVTRWGIDSFAEEKGPDGKPLRPDFDIVLPELIQLYSADPNRDMKDAYEQARWMNPQTRAKLIEAERSAVQRKASDERARQAVRGNVRGVTSPVTKPTGEPGVKQNLRDMLENTADEIGFGN